MMERQDTPILMIWDAPPSNPIRTIFEQVKIMPNIKFYQVEKPIPVLSIPTLRNHTNNKIAYNISAPKGQLKPQINDHQGST